MNGPAPRVVLLLAPEARSEALKAPRFHSPALLHVLLEKAAEAEWMSALLALLGLLYVEQGLLDSAFGPLRRAQPFMTSGKSWLAARASLSLGVCFAAHGQELEAWDFVEEALRLRRSAKGSERPLLKWLQGKLVGYLGDLIQAFGQLDSARRTLLAERRWIEAGLVSLDQAALYAEADRPGEIAVLMADLSRAATGISAGKAAGETLARFDELIAPPRARAALLGSHLLQMARIRRLGAPSLPWV